MDVQMPDGTIITGVPEGTTQKQLRDLLQKRQAPQSDRPVGDFLNDAAYAIAEGGGTIVKNVGQLAGMMPFATANNPITRTGQRSIDAARAMRSQTGVQDEQEFNRNVAQAEKEGGQIGALGATLKGLATNPRLFATEAIKQIPQVVPSAIAGGLTRAGQIMRGVEPTKKAIMTAIIGTGATQQSADVAGEAYDEALKATNDPDTAKDRAIQAFMASMPASVASQFMFGSGGRSFERVLGGVEGRQLGAKQFVKAVIGEPLQENTEELSGKLIVNAQAQKLDPNIPLERGMGQTAGMATAMGGVYGTVGGVRETLSEPRRETIAKNVERDIEALRHLHERRVEQEYTAAGVQDAGTGQEVVGPQFGGIRAPTDLEQAGGERVRAKRIGEQGMSLEPQRMPNTPAASIMDADKATMPKSLFVGDTGKTDPRAVINWLKTDKTLARTRPERQLLAAAIEPYLDPSLRIEVVSTKDFNRLFGEADAHSKYGGFYNAKENAIYLNPTMGTNSQTVLHEMLHATTEKLLQRYITEVDGSPTAVMGAPRAVTDIVNLYRHVKQEGQFNEDYYGMTDISEFIAEVHANPMFQAYLASMPYKGGKGQEGSLWSKIVEYIANLLDFPIDKKNVLAEALALSDKAMQLQKEQLVSLTKYVNSTFRAQELREVKAAANKALDGDIAVEELAASGDVKITDQEDAKEQPFEKLGIETGRIPEDPDVNDPGLIARIMQDQDGSAKWDWAYPGALQAADIRNSVLIRTVYRLMDNATKRAKKFERDFITPLENTWSKLLRNRESTMRLLGVFKLELENGVNFKDEDLSQILDEKEMAAYTDMRDVLELSWKEQNTALVAVGLKPVTKLESYYAARWRGPYRSVIRNKDGKPVWVVAERTRGHAQRALKWIQQRNPDLVAEEIKYHKSRDSENMLQAGYLELLKILDMKDPDSIALHEAWKEAMLGKTEDVLGQEKHFKRKTGVQGFAGARPWEDQYMDAKEFFIEQIKYMKAAAQWSAMQVPASKVKDLLSNTEIAKGQKNNVKYAKAYLRNHLGYSTAEWINRLEQAVADTFGRDTEFGENIVGGMKSLFYIAQLGFNLPYIIYAAIQPTLSAGKHAQFTSDGYHHSVALTSAMAFKDGLAFSLAHLGRYMVHVGHTKPVKHFGETLDSLSRKMLSENGKIATDYIEANGVVDITPTTDIMDLRVPKWVSKTRDYGGWTISAVEILSRSMAYYSFVHHLAQSDKKNLSTDDILILADDATKDVMADYRPSERAMLFNQAGLAGKGLATLQTFKFNWMAQVLKYWKLGINKGQWRPFVMQMSSYFLLAGLAGFIGIDDADDMWRYTLSLMGDKEFAKWKNYSPKMIITRNLDPLIAYGAISGVTGTNIYTRGSLGDIIPINPTKGVGENILNFFPFISTGAAMAYGAVRGGMELAGVGNRDTNIAAVHKGMPAAMRGPFEVESDMYEENGTLVSLSDPSLGVYKRTDKDRFARYWGLRTLREAQATEGRYRHRDIKAETDKRRGAAANDFWSASLKKDNRNAVEYLEKYIELGGDPKHLLSTARMREAYKRQTLDYLTQLALKAKPQNEAAVREFLEYMMFYSPTYDE